jgi:hypothetical protein
MFLGVKRLMIGLQIEARADFDGAERAFFSSFFLYKARLRQSQGIYCD